MIGQKSKFLGDFLRQGGVSWEKSMDRGNSGHNNKPKLSTQEKKQKKKTKQMAKMSSLAPTP